MEISRWIKLGAATLFACLVLVLVPGPMEVFWFNLPGRAKRAEVRELLEQAAKTSPGGTRTDLYMKIAERSPGGMSTSYALTPFIFNVIEDEPTLRVVGLEWVRTMPSTTDKERYAPKLSLLIQWLEDSNADVVEASLAVLNGYTWRKDCRRGPYGTLPPDEQKRIRDGWVKWYGERDFAWSIGSYVKKDDAMPKSGFQPSSIDVPCRQ